MTEDNPIGTAWRWVSRAPLPVVMALLLILGTYTYGVADDAKTAKTKAEAADTKAEDAKQAVHHLNDQLDKANDKLDKLLEAVAALKQQARDNAATAARKP